MKFTEEMQNHLRKMGWNEGRKTVKFDDYMEQHNYPEFIREFIREYGKLKVIELLKKNDTNVINETVIDPVITEMGPDSLVEDWANDLGIKLYGIGEYSPESYDIAVDENGAVYFLGEYCQCVGKNLYESIEAVVRIDQWSQLEVKATDTTSGIWLDIRGDEVDFDSYKFKYKKF